MYYLYRHIRLDKNEVFYIGIGTVPKTNYNISSIKTYYNRAFEKVKSRNKYWKNITNITDYLVEILYETDNIKLIQLKEKEFIKLYKNTLCNLTDGGLGIESYNHKKETKLQISNSMKGRKLSDQHRININKRKFIKIIMYNDSFNKEFDSISEAAMYIGVNNIGNISSCLKGKRSSAYGYKFKHQEITESKDKEL
ncbi:hypothetical protein BOX09_gp64 [Flavobacterium phage Fpv1]|uniref:DNA endonuclease I-HmuI-like NUMOD-like domain-containing protein n=2 Tax=Fipvunavirus Fpv1 TaxID=2560475 RepID=A0A1B0WKI4_9CAUD|nr:hypothetical protein BOW81_gp64 [Flavobacterium phage Fpv20]YP_009322066.1 hypothetical protein BOX09_gp64 [Flavobacterium phage Fpv1]YP_009323655.1 hypothetical protein BOW82_gp64 [Flavobacterium phage Fpv2]ALN97308.1 hypothetical protein [Flavobacterium phage FpV21]QCW20278.1 hypothetical protein [Flavobacterium phage FPSV-F12]QCW20725.1 hypothetical protein [Flavobacterium phage FPSV-S29]ANB40306.1 hypothetical protein [Flavobacterium phage Fpv1]ANB40386.1 hypothetical protein [Flavoba